MKKSIGNCVFWIMMILMLVAIIVIQINDTASAVEVTIVEGETKESYETVVRRTCGDNVWEEIVDYADSLGIAHENIRVKVIENRSDHSYVIKAYEKDRTYGILYKFYEITNVDTVTLG